ncbi:MAG: CRTAC1 family protein [Limisphaerales bacterium]
MRDRRPTPPRSRFPPGFVILVAALLLALLAAKSLLRRQPAAPVTDPGQGSLAPNASTLPPEVLREFLAIEARESEAARTTWAADEAAQAWAVGIEAFWDQLNRRRGELQPLLAPPARSLAAPPAAGSFDLPLGITAWTSASNIPPTALALDDPRVAQWRAEGWGLDQSEWRHVRFQPDTGTGTKKPASRFDVRLHLSRPSPPARVQIDARLRIDWPTPSPAPDGPSAGDWTVEHWDILRRDGEVAFQEAARLEIPPFPKTTWIDPLIAASPASKERRPNQFLLAARNLRVVRGEDGAWSATALSPHHPGLIFTALLGDFTGDGHDDLLCVVRSGILILPGDAGLGFEQPALRAWTAPERLLYAQAITCGDIDHDGDLDLFLGQYRTPYESGQMPRPFFDALDGPPGFLLKNRGDGTFDDTTAAAGLAPKRHRRSYAASFVDLDSDGDLDLLVTSDFAGVDVHENDGRGRFADRSGTWIDDPRAFGMSHLFSDFDADGALDCFVAGMPQPTADRLHAIGAERPGHESWRHERARITFGNRLYFGASGGAGWLQREVGSEVARGGWAWSAADVDLNHDGFPEIHVINGHETRASVRDYEREFWLHDIYVGDSTPRPEVDAYFSSKFATTRAQGWSYGGYEKNRLYLNLGGTRFVEAAHVLGLALENDCRNVLADDFDGDGDQDLLVSTFDVWPAPLQTLRLLENTLAPEGHWIEIQPDPSVGSAAALGAMVRIRHGAQQQVRTLVTGAGYRSQAAPVARFGLGRASRVDEVEVRWPGGQVSRIQGPGADQRHFTAPPPP